MFAGSAGGARPDPGLGHGLDALGAGADTVRPERYEF